VFVFALASCARHETSRPADTPAARPVEVHTAAVVRASAAGQLTAPAVVQARRRAALASRLAASVTALPFREGERVEQGAVVARMDDAPLRAALAAAEAGLAAAQSDLHRAQALLAKGAATPREVEQMETAASAARAQLTAARDTLAHATVRAPFAGRIAARAVNVGDVVGPGAPLLEIEGEGGLELRATVEPDVAATLRPGARLQALVDRGTDPLPVTVTAVAPSGDPITHRFEVKADLPSAPGLRAGVFARLLVPGPAAEPALLVPASALFERGGLSGVFVVSEGRARLRWVAPGAREGAWAEVRAGVMEGEQVVTDARDLVDGTPVMPRGEVHSAAARRPDRSVLDDARRD
jgi:RND family efflux transporter MFP subunit